MTHCHNVYEMMIYANHYFGDKWQQNKENIGVGLGGFKTVTVG